MSNPKYIDADRLIAKLYDLQKKNERECVILAVNENEIIELLKHENAADVVPVVRCGECKFYTGTYCHNNMQYGLSVTESDYCSKGERKNG